MLKIKQAMGKTTKSACVEAACLIEGSEFWQAKLHLFIQDLPAQVEIENAMVIAKQLVKDGTFFDDEEKKQKILDLVKKLAEWRVALRPCSFPQG